ncbi:hypothetical protein CQA66_08010 [Helicobacter aurati]|uniref:Uncharacterized protein n=1 Tax=Helicobacter aurati TaxID=137778 RepID=A0A3D8IZU2_9HELI|nr:hypothetical protein [Helicobacter aurati]RDU70496.1 hypothetical protein CQA66_08010 [Helicobacter aurati]
MRAQLESEYLHVSDSKDSNYACLPESNHSNNVRQQLAAQSTIAQNINITVENRIFNLNLENLEIRCRNNIIQIFKDKNYSLEELLVLFVSNIRDQSLAEIELNNILQSLKTPLNVKPPA